VKPEFPVEQSNPVLSAFFKTLYFVVDFNDVLGQLEIILRLHVEHIYCSG